MAFNPSEFRNNFLLDGARPTLFSVALSFPAIANSPVASSRSQFLVRATTLPASQIGIAPTFYFGRQTKHAGDRVFSDWAIDVYCDEDYVIRNAFEAWSNAINSHTLNVRAAGAISLAQYSVDANVIQYSKTGVPAKSYTFRGIWPTNVGDVQLSWDAQNQIETFQVQLAVQEWVSDTTT